ncbi:DinB family protein [Flavobacterium restrictum]|uniref:DinB family protein n=1 Tax=Flavobacterium restrictum TaxID=2594428 RepID=A0A553E575_9FLAO|nr:DinB family protein [Flavobacterium restrictum]TRX40013.1 DinB family protein [Flavobacterium restrictum]
MLIPSIHKSLTELTLLLNQISNEDYARPCTELSHATIGEHTRHIIEMFQCLATNYELGIVNYDARARNIQIQTNTHYAVQQLLEIQQNLVKENKHIELQQLIDGEKITIQSNYNRELLYNLEHCIHHQALIKVALLQCKNISIDVNFGVARSTIEYRKQCVQ